MQPIADKKVCLIIPPDENIPMIWKNNECSIKYKNFQNLSFIEIGTRLKISGFNIKLYDCIYEKINYSTLASKISNNSYYIYLLYINKTVLAKDAILTAELIKSQNQDSFVILFGEYPLLYPDFCTQYPNIDFVLRGIPHNSIINLCNYIFTNQKPTELLGIKDLSFKHLGKEYINSNLSYLNNINELSVSDRNLIKLNKHKSLFFSNKTINLRLSKGCSYQCKFCNIAGQFYRKRNKENIVKEIKYIKSLGFEELFFEDGLFAFLKNDLIDLCNIFYNLNIKWSCYIRPDLIDEDTIVIMKKSGLQNLFFRIDAFTDEFLKNLNRGLKYKDILTAINISEKYKINTIGTIYLGLKNQSKKEIIDIFKKTKKLKLDSINYEIYKPVPGAKLYVEALNAGNITYDFWRDYAKNPLQYIKTKFDIQFILNENVIKWLKPQIRKQLLLFYLNPTYIYNQIRKKNTKILIKIYLRLLFCK